MSRIDELKPDQRAALQLLLKQGRSYEEIATMLRIETRAVRERARAALDALGPEDVQDLPLEDQDDVADYLLGQQSASRRAQTRDLLERSAPARAWARTVSSELRPLAGDTLPEIPSEAAEVDEAFGALQARTAHRERTEKSSRVGGAILLFAIALLVVGVLVLVIGGDDDDSGDRAETQQTQTQTQPAGQPEIVGQANLTSEGGGNDAPTGIALITKEGNQYALGVQAENMPRTSDTQFYGVWLVGDNRTRFVGFGPAVTENGQLAGADQLNYDPRRYGEVRITRETQREPRRPGETVIAGQIQQPPAEQPGGEGSGGAEAEPEGG